MDSQAFGLLTFSILTLARKCALHHQTQLQLYHFQCPLYIAISLCTTISQLAHSSILLIQCYRYIVVHYQPIHIIFQNYTEHIPVCKYAKWSEDRSSVNLMLSHLFYGRATSEILGSAYLNLWHYAELTPCHRYSPRDLLTSKPTFYIVTDFVVIMNSHLLK